MYLTYDVEKIAALRELYTENIRFIKQHLPKGIDWDSRIQLKKFFKDHFNINILNVTISHLATQRDKFDHDSEEYDILNGVVTYLRYKYMIKNYLDCIIRHNDNGKIYLRLGNGELLFPNKRPLPRSPEIESCLIIEQHHQPKEKDNGSNF